MLLLNREDVIGLLGLPDCMAAVEEVFRQYAHGELPIAAGLVSSTDIHADLCQLAAGQRASRTTEAEILLFDSTGTALRDAAVAAPVYERAQRSGRAAPFEPA